MTSQIVYEIQDGRLIYQGWYIRGDHIPHYPAINEAVFGESGIRLVVDRNNVPSLTVPDGQVARLLESDFAETESGPKSGKFVAVEID